MARIKKKYPCGQSRQPKDGTVPMRRSATKRYAMASPERERRLRASLENHKRMYGVYPR
jgi:hypothetical protein